MKKILKNPPIAFLITFRGDSTWYHGDKKLSVDPKHNQFGEPKIQFNSNLAKKMHENSRDKAFILNYEQRRIVLNAILHICQHFDWHVFAAHVLSNHVHIIVKADCNPEHVMTQIKACATRSLKKHHAAEERHKNWSRHGSTKYIYKREDFNWIMRYVIDEQGSKVIFFHDDSYNDEVLKKVLRDVECMS